jgi:branched-chain amino acid transport system ATP-binding protein
MSNPALEFRGAWAGYGRITVLRDISLAIEKSAVLALLGPNGAGKTTLLRLASGQLRASSGSVLAAGDELSGLAPEAIARRGICTIPEGRGIFPNLSVAENVRMWTHTRRARRRDIEDRVYSSFPQLAGRRKQPAGSLSGGEQQMLAISRALSSDPLVLLIDELSIGLAPKIVEDLYHTLRELAASGTAVLIAEQNAEAALRVSDSAALMSQGRVVITGTPQEIRAAAPDFYLHNPAARSRQSAEIAEKGAGSGAV